MNNASNVFAGSLDSLDQPDTVTRLREEWRVARAAHAELTLLGMPPVNLLLRGPDGVLDYLLDALLPDLREPIGRWCPGEQLLLPPPALIGTIIFQDVGEMPYDDQGRLLEWLGSAAGRTQVVSTTADSLLEKIEDGRFIEALFYRLNIVSIDASP